MHPVVCRFLDRLAQPSGAIFRVINFRTYSPKTNCLELYHCLRNDYSMTYEEQIVSILKHGLQPSWLGNKGSGVYLANHGRYSLRYAGYKSPVLICHIQPGPHVECYRSEVASESTYTCEYVITDSTKIHIAYVLNYVVTDIDYSQLELYVDHGHFGCSTCDPKNIRCDCLQQIDDRDYV